MSKKIVIDNQLSYYLHPSEGSKVAMTSIVFNGKNYNLWKQATTIALKSKNKLGSSKEL